MRVPVSIAYIRNTSSRIYAIIPFMKKIFWGIQNLVGIGGTEMVSVRLMNLLADSYEIHLICSSKFKKEEISYKLDERIHLHTLGINPEVCRVDQYALTYLKKFQLLKLFKLLHETFSLYLWKKNKFRREIKRMMGKDDIYIASAMDSYMFAPKDRRVFFHFHFNAEQFESFANLFAFHHSVKPEKYIFLTKSTEEEVSKKHKKVRGRATYVNNPNKFKPVESSEYHNNAILFVGRFTEQKDPMLALRTAKYLKDKSFPFSMTMYGEGHLESKMREYQKRNGLDEVKIITHHVTTQEDFLSHDLLLLTSAYEGFALVTGEANSSSLSIVTSKWDGPVEEVVKEGEGGFIIPTREAKDYGDKIIWLLSDKDRLLESKKKAYEFSKRLDTDRIVSKWKEILG